LAGLALASRFYYGSFSRRVSGVFIALLGAVIVAGLVFILFPVK
jgi:hypothetical protein